MKKSLAKFHLQLKEIEILIPQMQSLQPEVSAVPVGWHLSHSLKVIYNVLKAIEKSDPLEYKKKFNFKRLLVLATGKFPRGKVRAPSSVLPDADLNPGKLGHQLEKAKQKSVGFEHLPKKAFFKHPFLNDLNRNQTIRFLVVHTEHHLKIAREIIAGSRK